MVGFVRHPCVTAMIIAACTIGGSGCSDRGQAGGVERVSSALGSWNMPVSVASWGIGRLDVVYKSSISPTPGPRG